MRAGVLGLRWLCAISLPASGQEAAGSEERVLFRHLTVEDGLPQEDVHALFEDSLGFLWIGTEDGLNRYDGHRFRTFRPTPFDTTSLSGTWVVGLADDGDEGLWVATETGGSTTTTRAPSRSNTFRLRLPLPNRSARTTSGSCCAPATARYGWGHGAMGLPGLIRPREPSPTMSPTPHGRTA